MKAFIAFAVLIVGITAFPQEIDFHNERLVTDAIAGAIQDVSQNIRDLGLDPLHIERDSGTVALPVPVIFSADGVVEQLHFVGLSDIVINNLNYALLTSRLTFDIELPQIVLSLDKADVDVTFFEKVYSASASGRLSISRIRVMGNIRVSIGIITGISIRSIDINFTLGDLESAVNVKLLGYDLSNSLNNFLGITIPTTLYNFSAEINELLEILITEIAEDVLN